MYEYNCNIFLAHNKESSSALFEIVLAALGGWVLVFVIIGTVVTVVKWKHRTRNPDKNTNSDPIHDDSMSSEQNPDIIKNCTGRK